MDYDSPREGPRGVVVWDMGVSAFGHDPREVPQHLQTDALALLRVELRREDVVAQIAGANAWG